MCFWFGLEILKVVYKLGMQGNKRSGILRWFQKCAPCTPNFEEICFNSYKGRCCFLEVKSSNKIETDQYFKKTLFYKLVLGFQGQTKITCKQSDLWKSLDPSNGTE
jgi:hypothetical protein